MLSTIMLPEGRRGLCAVQNAGKDSLPLVAHERYIHIYITYIKVKGLQIVCLPMCYINPPSCSQALLQVMESRARPGNKATYLD